MKLVTIFTLTRPAASKEKVDSKFQNFWIFLSFPTGYFCDLRKYFGLCTRVFQFSFFSSFIFTLKIQPASVSLNIHSHCRVLRIFNGKYWQYLGLVKSATKMGTGCLSMNVPVFQRWKNRSKIIKKHVQYFCCVYKFG